MSLDTNSTAPCELQGGELHYFAEMFYDCEEPPEASTVTEEGFVVINKKRRARSSSRKRKANAKAAAEPVEQCTPEGPPPIKTVAAEPAAPEQGSAARLIPPKLHDSSDAAKAAMATMFMAAIFDASAIDGPGGCGGASKSSQRRTSSRAPSCKRDPALAKADKRAQSVGARQKQMQRMQRGSRH